MAAGVDAAGRAIGETGVDSGSRDAGLGASGAPVVAVSDAGADVGASPAVAIDEGGSGLGVASMAFVGSAVGVALSGAGRLESAGLGRIGTAAVRRGDERAGVDGGRPDATLLEVTFDGDDFSGVMAVRSRFATDRSSGEDVTFGRSTVCCAGAGAASVTTFGAVAELWSIEGDAGCCGAFATSE